MERKDMFDKMKALMDMQAKMKQVKRELDAANIEVESPDGLIKITMSGSQEVREIKIQKRVAQEELPFLERALKEGFNKAMKRSQEIAAEKMKAITGMGFPGM